MNLILTLISTWRVNLNPKEWSGTEDVFQSLGTEEFCGEELRKEILRRDVLIGRMDENLFEEDVKDRAVLIGIDNSDDLGELAGLTTTQGGEKEDKNSKFLDEI